MKEKLQGKTQAQMPVRCSAWLALVSVWHLQKLDTGKPVSGWRIDTVPIIGHATRKSALPQNVSMLLSRQLKGHEPICHDLPQFAAIQIFDAQNAITKHVKRYCVVNLAIARLCRLAPCNKSRSDATDRGSKNARCCAPCHTAKAEPLDLPQNGIENF